MFRLFALGTATLVVGSIVVMFQLWTDPMGLFVAGITLAVAAEAIGV